MPSPALKQQHRGQEYDSATAHGKRLRWIPAVRQARQNGGNDLLGAVTFESRPNIESALPSPHTPW